MPTRADIVASTRKLIDTPYLHQGRVAGPNGGLDCIGNPVWVSWDCSIKPRSWNITGYRRLPDGHSLMRHLHEHMGGEIAQSEMRPGDLVVVSYARHPHHVGIVVDHPLGCLGIVHASGLIGRVVETQLTFTTDMKFVTAFRFPGVD